VLGTVGTVRTVRTSPLPGLPAMGGGEGTLCSRCSHCGWESGEIHADLVEGLHGPEYRVPAEALKTVGFPTVSPLGQ
jgi:hypothetical protein